MLRRCDGRKWPGCSNQVIRQEPGLGHPHYDLATLAMFLNLNAEMTLELIALHDQTPPDATSLANFAALRQLPALLCGITFLSLFPI
jgi:hypothetical protein